MTCANLPGFGILKSLLEDVQNPTLKPFWSVCILVVDDFQPFRQFVSSTLQARPEWQVICEVSDGLEAVQKAHELKPDLILLDIGLPSLSGIEAAKRIHQVVPGTKILFLTRNNDADVVRAALNDGAQGYVLKTDAGNELWSAIEAVLQGKRFISSGLRRLKTSS
jgi:DNA-binding NarL/FixJ family response regulator